MDKQRDENFLKRLNSHPKLRDRVEALLNVMENTAGDCTKADDAEQRVADELKQMGSDILHGWAKNAVLMATEELKKHHPHLRKNGKKSPLAYPVWKNRNHRAASSLLE